jgi:hypothetical protein
MVIPANEYRLALDQANKLADRRQAITATYLSVNAALTGAIAFLFKEGRLPDVASEVTVLALLFSGVVACDLWRRLIKHDSSLVGWWYGWIRFEINLTWLFTTIYLVFGVAILVAIALRFV